MTPVVPERYWYTDAAGKTCSTRGEFKRWTRKGGVRCAVFQVGQRPLLVPRYRLARETLRRIEAANP